MSNSLAPASEALSCVQEALEAHLGHLTRLRDLWLSRPYRGERPRIRVVISAHFDARGSYSIRWDPVTTLHSDTKPLKDLARSELPIGWNTLTIPALSDRTEPRKPADEALFRAAFKVPALLASALGRVSEAHVSACHVMHAGGGITACDIENVERAEITSGLAAIEKLPWILLAEVLYAVERGMTAADLKQTCQRVNHIENIDHHSAAMALAIGRRVLAYNAAWWRSAAKFELPKPRGFRRRAKPGRKLVRVSGAKARHSSVAPRGNEGRRIAPRGQMQSYIRNRLAERDPDWAFTAGDFSEFAKTSDRKRITRALDALVRKGELQAIAKGVYCSAHYEATNYAALKAVMRDRGEHCAPGPESAGLVLEEGCKAAFDFYTNGPLKIFRVRNQVLRLHREPVPGLCSEIQSFAQPAPSILLVRHLTGQERLSYESFDRLAGEFPDQLRLSMILTGMLL